MTSNNIILNRFFTRSVFLSLINHQDFAVFNTCIKRYLSDKDLTSNNHQIITKLYHYLKKQYRNEYYYKNTLLNKILLGSHSLNTTVALSEIPVNKSKADIVLVNDMMQPRNYKTRYDILILAGSYGEATFSGPNFKFKNINVVYDLKLTGSNIPDSIGKGQNLHITAEVDEYNKNSEPFFLKSVSTEIR